MLDKLIGGASFAADPFNELNFWQDRQHIKTLIKIRARASTRQTQTVATPNDKTLNPIVTRFQKFFFVLARLQPVTFRS